MRVVNLLLIIFIFNTNLVFSKHHRHSLGLRGNQDTEKQVDSCVLHCQGNNTLAEKIHCSLNDFLENRTRTSGVIYFTTGVENTYSILEDNSKSVLSGVKEDSLEFALTAENVINRSIADLLVNGSTEFNSKSNDIIGNNSISSLFLDTEDNFLAEFDKFSSIYGFESAGQKELGSENLIDTLINGNKTIESSDKLDSNQELIDKLIQEEFNTTIEVLEEISERFPDIRELTNVIKGEKSVSIRELLSVTSRLMRSLNTIDENISDIDDISLEKLKERLSDEEIEKLKEQSVDNSTVVKQPWYAPFKKLGINIISGKNTIFSVIISIIESVIGFSPVGSIVSIVVRVIAAIVTIIHDIIQRRKSNSNLIRVLRSLDSFDASELSKVSLANKLIGRISENAENIKESQFLLRELYKDLSELAFAAEKNLHEFNENVIMDQLNKIISGKLASMSSNNSTTNLQYLNQNGSYFDKYSSRVLLTSKTIIRTDFNKGFSAIADEVEEYLNHSYNLSWDSNEFKRSLNTITEGTNSTIINVKSNSTQIITTTTTSTTSQPTKVKWYDGLIQFSKKVTELSGVVSMLDMLLELFTVVFGNSQQAESILSVLRLIVYLIKSVFNIFSNISSNRKLIGVTRVIPEEIAYSPRLLQLTMDKIKKNMDSAQLERDIINSQIQEIIKISEPDNFELVDQEFDKYLTFNATENLLNETKLRRNASVEARMHVAEYYLMHDRLLSVSESSVMATELNFKSWMEKVGAFFDNSYEKIKQVIKSIFATIFKGNKIVAFIDKLIDLIISVIRSIYHAFKNKSTQRLLIQAIEECEEQEIHNLLQKQLENTLKNEDTPILRLLL
ncbi:putative signal peptide-containing protein [Cryptosporidium hominis]